MTPQPSPIRTGRAAVTLNVARAGYGLVQLVVPARSDRRLLGHRIDARVRIFSRVLGARQLGQACVSGRWPSYPVLALGVEVDLVHAITLIALGSYDRPRRRAAFIDAGFAVCFAVAGALSAHAATPRPHRTNPLDAVRQAYAHRLAGALVPGYPTTPSRTQT